MSILSKPKRYHDIATLLWEFGSADLVQQAQLDQALLEEQMQPNTHGNVNDADPNATNNAADKKTGQNLARALEKRGPTFIKLGQMLSGRPDVLPQEYMEQLSDLHDNVEPFAYEQVEALIHQEFGVALKKLFPVFNKTPQAAASLGQVHFAELHDGTPVAVKIQRPNIRQEIIDDLALFENIARNLDKNTDLGRKIAFQQLLQQTRKALLRELDYLQEAENLQTMQTILKDYDKLTVPSVHKDYCTSRVLTMQRIDGKNITQSHLTQLEAPVPELVEQFYRAYLDQVLVHGFVHADPHPGNILLTADNQLALIDLGMVTHIDSTLQDQILRLLLAIADGEGEAAANMAIDICHPLDDFNDEQYRLEVSDLVNRFSHTPAERLREGRVLAELIRIGSQCGLRPAPQLTMLGKTLMHLDQVADTLLPEFDTQALLRRHAESLIRQRTLNDLKPSAALARLIEFQELAKTAPKRINTILGRLANNELSIGVDAIDEKALITSLQKIANRVTAGIVIAALVISAALIMRVESTVTVLGYPILALGMFLLAAACGFILLYQIWKHDN